MELQLNHFELNQIKMQKCFIRYLHQCPYYERGYDECALLKREIKRGKKEVVGVQDFQSEHVHIFIYLLCHRSFNTAIHA